jgi:hypothetical protein
MRDSPQPGQPGGPLSLLAHWLLPAVVAGVWVWVLFGWLVRADESLRGRALMGGVVAGWVVGPLLWLFVGKRRLGTGMTFLLAIVLPVAGVLVLAWFQDFMYAADPDGFPDWQAIAVWGALAGAFPAGACQVLIIHSSARLQGLAVGLAFIVGLLAPDGMWYRCAEYDVVCRHDAPCTSNLKQLGRAMLMYADDYDGHLPPVMPFRDTLNSHGLEVVLNWRFVRQEGPCDGVLYPYVKTSGLWFCPIDWGWHDRLKRWRPDYYPDPGVSYRWDVSLGGKSIGDVPDPESVPMIFDRAPFHEGYRNVAFAEGHVGRIAEEEWERLGVEGR